MSNEERITQTIYRAVDALNKQLPKGTHVEKSPDVVLYGKSGKLESLDFVTFIMEVEEKFKEEFGTEITITDEKLLSKQDSPFTTLRTLTEYLSGLLKETRPENA
jgi:acyl carrier protein